MNRFESPLASTLGNVLLRDVTLRDGLQLTGKLLPAEQKIETVRELLRLGVPAIELGSMARADLVPTMANTLEVVQALTPPEELEKCWIWVATPGHVAKHPPPERGTSSTVCLPRIRTIERTSGGLRTRAWLPCLRPSSTRELLMARSNCASPRPSPARSRVTFRRNAYSPSPTIPPAPKAPRTSSSATPWGKPCRRR